MPVRILSEAGFSPGGHLLCSACCCITVNKTKKRTCTPTETNFAPTMPAFEETQTLAILEDGIENGTSSSCTISELRAGKPLVLDLWHTKCTRCPDALTKLDMLAASGKHAGVVFASCALSLCDKPDGPESEDAGREQVTELIDDMWDNLKHCYMTAEEKVNPALS